MPEWITKYWVEWVFGLIIAGMTFVIKKLSSQIKKQKAENQALRDGIRCLLKAQIIEDCKKALRDGYCGPELRDLIQDIYTSYKTLGGNGTAESMVHQVMGLPAIKPEKGEST